MCVLIYNLYCTVNQCLDDAQYAAVSCESIEADQECAPQVLVLFIAVNRTLRKFALLKYEDFKKINNIARYNFIAPNQSTIHSIIGILDAIRLTTTESSTLCSVGWNRPRQA